MDRQVFHKLFKCAGPAVLPVIHVLDFEQTRKNVQVALTEGAQGVFLINHDFSYDRYVCAESASSAFDETRCRLASLAPSLDLAWERVCCGCSMILVSRSHLMHAACCRY